MSDLLSFNGVDARTGRYLLELTQAQVVAAAAGEPVDGRTLQELRHRRAAGEAGHYGVVEGVDVGDLAQAGWCVVFPAVAPNTPEAARQAAIREALAPLFELRRRQAAAVKESYFKVIEGPEGYRADEGKQKFLARHGAGPGPADPAKVPYYLLLVGDPEAIPYRVQSQLSVQRAVGRLHFDTVEEYAHYAQSVVLAETGGLRLPKQAAFFGVANPDDGATQASAVSLVGPLADALAADARFAGWSVSRHQGEGATRAALGRLLDDAPALFFAACHGMGFPKGDPAQVPHQGALLCQDWPGPKAWRQPIPEAFYFAGDHLRADQSLLGNLSFFFACYGAGTPRLDEFAAQAFKERAAIAPHAFVAGLPKAMLNRPKGGALAVVGHVERAWGYSFLWQGTGGGARVGAQTAVFESTMKALVGGMPVGAAMEYFDERYAELASDLSVLLEERDAGMEVDEYALASMWTANNDARGYAILGDPAVRLVAAADAPARPREALVATLGGAAAPGAATPAPAPAATPAPAPAAPVATPAESYSLLGRWGREPASADAPSSLQTFVTRIGETLTRALDDASSLEVSTYVADDLGSARFEGGKMVGAELRAFTRVALDGDSVVCLPQKDGAVDREVWELHLAMVKQAQEARAELLKTLVAAATSLASLGK